MEIHIRTTGCRLPYGITCHPDTSEHTPLRQATTKRHVYHVCHTSFHPVSITSQKQHHLIDPLRLSVQCLSCMCYTRHDSHSWCDACLFSNHNKTYKHRT